MIATIHHPLHHVQRFGNQAQERQLPAVQHQPLRIVEAGVEDRARVTEAVVRTSLHRGQLRLDDQVLEAAGCMAERLPHPRDRFVVPSQHPQGPMPDALDVFHIVQRRLLVVTHRPIGVLHARIDRRIDASRHRQEIAV